MRCGVSSVALSVNQRQSDLDWIFQVFERNYAPLEYKKESLNINFESVKNECRERNQKIPISMKGNAEFNSLVSECVSKFKDAHTSILLGGAISLGKAQVSYLGFTTERTKNNNEDALLVKNFLPSTNDPNYPIKIDDVIIKVDDQLVKLALEEIVTERDLGQVETNLTVAAENFPLRNSLSNRLPQKSEISFTILRNNEEIKVTLPWIIKDYYTFETEQSIAKKSVQNGTSQPSQPSSPNLPPLPTGSSGLFNELYNRMMMSFSPLDGILTLIKKWNAYTPLKVLTEASFTYFEINPTIAFIENNIFQDSTQNINSLRDLPIVDEISNKSFAAYLLQKKEDSPLVGYIYLPSFSISDPDVFNFEELIKKINKLQVKGLIIDLIDNGGGSLVHGMRVANLLTQNLIDFPNIEVRLNDNWLDTFSQTAIKAPSDSEREWAKRISERLKTDLTKNQRLSSSFSTKELDPFFSQAPKKSALGQKTKIVFLVNEMCASMCDIFATVARDNKLGIIVGTQTMGAGGNVTMHAASPSSHFVLRQTESLIKSKSSYIENNGVIPDVITDTVSDRRKRFKNTIDKALDLAIQ